MFIACHNPTNSPIIVEMFGVKLKSWFCFLWKCFLFPSLAFHYDFYTPAAVTLKQSKIPKSRVPPLYPCINVQHSIQNIQDQPYGGKKRKLSLVQFDQIKVCQIL